MLIDERRCWLVVCDDDDASRNIKVFIIFRGEIALNFYISQGKFAVETKSASNFLSLINLTRFLTTFQFKFCKFIIKT